MKHCDLSVRHATTLDHDLKGSSLQESSVVECIVIAVEVDVCSENIEGSVLLIRFRWEISLYAKTRAKHWGSIGDQRDKAGWLGAPPAQWPKTFYA